MDMSTSQLRKESNESQSLRNAEHDANVTITTSMQSNSPVPNTVDNDWHQQQPPRQVPFRIVASNIPDIELASAPASVQGGAHTDTDTDIDDIDDIDDVYHSSSNNNEFPIHNIMANGNQAQQQLESNDYRQTTHLPEFPKQPDTSSSCHGIAKLKKSITSHFLRKSGGGNLGKRSKTGPTFISLRKCAKNDGSGGGSGDGGATSGGYRSECTTPSTSSSTALSKYYVHVPIERSATKTKFSLDTSVTFISLCSTWKQILEHPNERHLQRRTSNNRRSISSNRFFPRWRSNAQSEKVSYCTNCTTGMCVALIESRKNLSTRDQLVQQLLRYVTRRDYAAPLENPHKILDIGAKDGAWIKDMSKQFPTCKIRGCEGFLLSDKKTSPLPHNCRIDLVNLCRRFPYGDNNFDYIHQRMMSFYTPVEVWAYRASEIFRMLRPGGYVEFVELDHDLIRPGPSAVTIHDWIREKLLLQGIDLTVVRHIDQLLQMAGFTDIHRHTIEIPMGPWGLVRGQVTMRLVSLIYSSVHQALLEGSNEPIVSRSLSHESEGELLNNMNSPMLDNGESDNRQKVSLDLEDHVNLVNSVCDEIESSHSSVVFHFYWARKPSSSE